MQPARVPLWFLLAVWLLVVGAFGLGLWLGAQRGLDLPEPQRTAFRLVLNEILRSHVEPQDEARLAETAIGGMVSALDEYSRYVPPAKAAKFDEDTTGSYDGIGLLMVQHGDDLIVHFPFVDSPAERAGLRPGDRILAVDGTPVTSFPVAERTTATNQRVRGPAGTKVLLQVARGGQPPFDVEVGRGAVLRPCVKWAHLVDADAGLGYVHIADFHQDTARQLAAAITALQQEPSGLRGLIVDLRFDGGGLLDEGVDTARLFVPKGTLVTTRRRGQVVESYDAIAARCQFPELPLIVLVNEQSASASEVLTGALQDHRRAAVVGVRTYGKGMVNTIFSWQRHDFRLKLTTAHYYTPSGRNIDQSHAPGATPADRGGIAPDIEATATRQQAQAILQALSQHEAPRRYRDDLRELASRLAFVVPGPVPPSEDPQLAAAIAALRERVASTAVGDAPSKDRLDQPPHGGNGQGR
ncbi:MAG: S41 family peptidase [Planctomycetes bacterium]|nr:S41 family peptidase [Planctomycetota bacterium]